MAHLTVSLLGTFQVSLDGRPVTGFKSNKARALLAYLAAEADRPHRRETLAGLLWPDRPDRDALGNLRYTLASLRRTLGDPTATAPFLLITHQTVQFNPGSDSWLDVAQLERALAGIRGQYPSTGDIGGSLALYRGPFLEGFSIGDAAPFEEWMVFRREQISQKMIAALGALVGVAEARGDLAEALGYARRQAELEPWNEEAHRALMRTLARNGQRNAALHQFQVCQRILREDLDVEPAEETIALYEAIRRGEGGRQVDKGEGGRQVDKDGGKEGVSDPPLSTCLPPSPLSTYLLVSPPPEIVAREEQLGQLGGYLAQALAGAGCVVCVTGEAGSGKTALLDEFARRAMQARPDLLVAGGSCDAAAGIGDPYLPFREILQVLTGDIEAKRAGTALTPEHARRLWTAMPDAVHALMERGPGLIDTFVPGDALELRAQAFGRQSGKNSRQGQLRLAVPPPARHSGEGSTLPLRPDLFQEVTDVFHSLARRHPLILVLDDLQWADAGSLSLLFHLGRRLAGSRILVVAAYRPDAMAPPMPTDQRPLALIIRELQHVSGIPAIDLDACEGRQFVDALLDREPNRLDREFREQMFRHTEGHPLFTVELLQGLKEQGDIVRDAAGCWSAGRALHWEHLPVRVEAVIAERISRLPERCQLLLASASVEGEEFTAEAVARVLDVDERSVVQCLSGELAEQHRLVSAVSLHRLGARRLSRYRFRHTLFRQYLYDHLDPVRRVRGHEATGIALEQLVYEAPDELEALAPRLAWHFEEAGLADRAAAYHLAAGNRAARLSAYDEAIAHFTRGSALLDTLPDTPERARLRLDLLLAMITPFSMARGFWASERIHALERAYAVSQHPLLSGGPERREVLAATAFFAFWSAQPDRTAEFGEQLLRLAGQDQDAHHVRLAHSLLGYALALRAELAEADRHLNQALEGYKQRGYDQPNLVFGIHVDVMSLALQATVRWLLGYPDQARRLLEEAMAMAQATNYAGTLGFAQTLTSILLLVFDRDPEAARRQVEALLLAKDTGLPFRAWAGNLASWATNGAQEGEAALKHERQLAETFRLHGTGVGYGVQLLHLARSYARAGHVQAGLDCLEELRGWIDRTSVHVLEAEVHRMRGELLLMEAASQQDIASAAEACIRQAIAIARQQEARWWELRAAVSLCRLLERRSRADDASRVEARQMLAETYGWFREGIAARDLLEAQELL